MEKNNNDLKNYMQKIANLAKYILDAHSVFIFLPKKQDDFQKNFDNSLNLVSYASDEKIKNSSEKMLIFHMKKMIINDKLTKNLS